MRISDWSSDVCSSDLADRPHLEISRVELRGQPLDDPALARRIPAFEHDDAALAVGDMRRLDALEPFLERHQIVAIMAVIFGAVFIVGEFDRYRFVPSESGRCYHSPGGRSEQHTSELQSLMRNSYAI